MRPSAGTDDLLQSDAATDLFGAPMSSGSQPAAEPVPGDADGPVTDAGAIGDDEAFVDGVDLTGEGDPAAVPVLPDEGAPASPVASEDPGVPAPADGADSARSRVRPPPRPPPRSLPRLLR
jgi:hypothetical protein